MQSDLSKILHHPIRPCTLEQCSSPIRRDAETFHPSRFGRLHAEHRYDLILLDLHMPAPDGFAVMEGLKEIEADSYRLKEAKELTAARSKHRGKKPAT